eukprot:GAHX01000592.1.p1 GENE.GAHX01000592.1~~GAHX01000592.1.p1  ORF type:complete len:778 (-),score=146.35 GAHX01000592.1:23-2356(-)
MNSQLQGNTASFIDIIEKFDDSIKDGNLHASLESAIILCRLFNQNKPPSEYYEMYVSMVSKLNGLSDLLRDSVKNTMPSFPEYPELMNIPTNMEFNNYYFKAEFCKHLVPRLYIMLTIASVWLEFHPCPLRLFDDVLNCLDGVLDPNRGLFLRFYFINTCKEHIIKASQSKANKCSLNKENPGLCEGKLSICGELGHAEELVMRNMKQSLKLWNRVGTFSRMSEKSKNIEYRNALKMLVGANVSLLGELAAASKGEIIESVLKNMDKYKETDKIYVIECLLSTFPVQVLTESASVIVGKLVESQSIEAVKSAICVILSKFEADIKDKSKAIEIPDSIKSLINNIIKLLTKWEVNDQIELLIQLFTLISNDKYIFDNNIAGNCYTKLAKINQSFYIIPSNIFNRQLQLINRKAIESNHFFEFINSLIKEQDVCSMYLIATKILTLVTKDNTFKLGSVCEENIIEHLKGLFRPDLEHLLQVGGKEAGFNFNNKRKNLLIEQISIYLHMVSETTFHSKRTSIASSVKSVPLFSPLLNTIGQLTLSNLNHGTKKDEIQYLRSTLIPIIVNRAEQPKIAIDLLKKLVVYYLVQIESTKEDRKLIEIENLECVKDILVDIMTILGDTNKNELFLDVVSLLENISSSFGYDGIKPLVAQFYPNLKSFALKNIQKKFVIIDLCTLIHINDDEEELVEILEKTVSLATRIIKIKDKMDSFVEIYNCCLFIDNKNKNNKIKNIKTEIENDIREIIDESRNDGEIKKMINESITKFENMENYSRTMNK